VAGEGPASDGAAKKAESFNEGNAKPFTAEDIRFTTKGDALYAIVLGVPSDTLRIKSLGKKANQAVRLVASVRLLGDSAAVTWNQDDAALNIAPPAKKSASDAAIAYEITFQ
jgi:alpha-L-fucosidase